MKYLPVLALAVIFPIYFALLWTAITWIISRFAWNALSKAFRAENRPEGQTFGIVSASIGGVGYNNCLTAIVTPGGLWLQPWKPFRLFHPPLFIPWKTFSPPEEASFL